MVKVKIGSIAPSFTLPSSTGENISLSQLLGKKNIVLFFYPQDEGPT
jgi:peroxiredoxin Q/BCP